MDSGNSGSLQSSSDGDDEYDSRAAVDSVSAFFAGGSVSIPPTQVPQPTSEAAAGFDPFSNFFNLHQINSNPNMALPGSGSSPRSDSNPFLSTSPAFTLPELPPPLPPRSQNNNNQAAARNPRKRTRASRRAPTTVLTTDTNNFRAMVQEFTGIPSPPFNNSPFSRTRFDPFGSRFTSMDAGGGGGAQYQHQLPQPPPFLRRPFPQKTPLPFLPSSSSLLSLPSSTTGIDAAAAAMAAASSSNDPSTTPIPQINLQFPISNPFFTPTLPPNPKFPIPSTSPQIEPKSFQIFPSNDDPFPQLGHGNLLPSDHHNAAAAPNNGGFSFIRTSSTQEINDVARGSETAGMVESSWICSSSE